MAKVISKKAVVKKKSATIKRNVLKEIGSKNLTSLNNAGIAFTRGIVAYRAAIHPGNGYGEIEIKDDSGVPIKIFAGSNPALFSAVLSALTNPTKTITQGGYVYVTG